jgi:GTPase
MFCDVTEMHFIGGNGGNGSMSFRREKFIAKGGPDGGNGGHGGAIVIRANPHIHSLIHFHSKNVIEGEAGVNGTGWQRHGKNGEDLIIEMPVGTEIKDIKTGKVLFDITEEEEEFVIVQGGRGGYGNEHFTSSIRQSPRFAELGEPGEERSVQLELKLVADVGIIGLPSAGKSTLISVLTAVKPKIADYPFTTLVPNIGIAQFQEHSFIMTDIPGLIEGASEGKGLGDKFLRHISRNSILVHLIDVNNKDIADSYKVIQKELKLYDGELHKKPQIIVLNKIDTDDQELEDMLVSDFRTKAKIPKKINIFCISALMQKGLKPLLNGIVTTLSQYEKTKDLMKQKIKKPQALKQYRPLEEEDSRYFEIQKEVRKIDSQEEVEGEAGVEKYIFYIEGQRINQIAIMTDFDNYDGVERLWDVFKKIGVWKELEKMGAKTGDKVGFVRFDGSISYREMIRKLRNS